MDSQDPTCVNNGTADTASHPNRTDELERTLAERKSAPFTDANVDSKTTRKRNTHCQGEDRGIRAQGRDNMPSAPDESAPIISTTPNRKDYDSISPQLLARSTSSETRTAQEGTLGSISRGQPQQRSEAEREAANAEQRDRSRWSAFWEKYGSVELENKGSVARDHLALERTFLAWLRTSLSFASIGIAVTQLFRLNTSLQSSPSSPAGSDSPATHLRHVGKPLGATFIGISIVILFIGFHRYFEAQHYVIRGKFPASRGSVILVSLVAGALILSSLVVILAVAPGTFEK